MSGPSAPPSALPPFLTAIRTAVKIKSPPNKLPPPVHLFEAVFALPGAGGSALGTVWRSPDGALHVVYIPEEEGEHTLELRFRGVRVGPLQRFGVQGSVPRGKPWRKLFARR